jgi:hypothetical protein
MAVFRAFKPEAMNKIAKAMGYTGNMSQFQDFIEQDPARKARMQQFTNAAMQMAKGGVVKMQTGGSVQKSSPYTYEGSFDKSKGPPRADDPRNAPMYDQFLQSPEYQNSLGQAGAAVLLPVQEGGQTYTFGSAVQGEAYKDYMQRMRSGGPAPEVLPNPMNPIGGVDPRSMIGPVGPTASLPGGPGTGPLMGKYGSGFRQPGDMGRYVAFNDPGQPGEGFANAAAYEAAQQQQTTPPAAPTEAPKNVQEASIQRMFKPGLPQGGVTVAATTPSEAGQYIDPRVGGVTGTTAVPTAMATTQQAATVQEDQAAQTQAVAAAPAVDAAVQATQAAQGTVDPRAQVTAAQQTASSVGNVTAAQGNAVLIDNPVQRQIQQGELISGAADAQTAAQFTEQIEANFDASNPPAWAAGALRSANAEMVARGLGSSSIAAQAIVQATMESALPIAQADASTLAQFESQNLSNRQQRAMLAAQQRAQFMGQEFDQSFQARVQNAAKISDIANQNFTAEQQVQLENSRLANTINLNNLSNRQALVVAEAAALAQMDQSNLNNRQQAAVQNAETFLQTDMANLSNQQQTELFKTQQQVQSLFTDQAAENASRQFNATSQNQVNQFFANLATQAAQFNAAQANAQSQFNAGQVNTVERFNAEINNQRDQFNAQNQLVIAQANAQWRRQIATADTAAVNRANELNANAVLDISKTAYANLWQHYADTMEWAWKSAEGELDRKVTVAVAELDAEAQEKLAEATKSSASKTAIGGLIGRLGSAAIEKGIFCWVAREVYGPSNTNWVKFRLWMQENSPSWLYEIYIKHGKSLAGYISNKPKVKYVIRYFMDKAIRSKFK